MSEYVTVEIEPTEDPDVLEVITNQRLTDAGKEVYPDFEAGTVGSPIAQLLFDGVPGIEALVMTSSSLLITRQPEYTWEEIVDEVRDALRDFFL